MECVYNKQALLYCVALSTGTSLSAFSLASNTKGICGEQ